MSDNNKLKLKLKYTPGMNNFAKNTISLGTGANNMRKSGNNVSGTASSGQNKQMAALIVGLVVVALLWVLGNYIYNYYTANQKSKVVKANILTTPHNGQSEFDIGSSELANSGYSNEYALSFWLYVDDYSYRQGLPKFIMRRGNIKTGVNPEVYLDPSVNTLRVNVSMMGNSSLQQGSGPEAKTTTTMASTTTTTPSTTTSSAITTTSIAPVTTPPAGGASRFVDIPKLQTTGEFNADSASAPGLIADPMAILGKLNNNSAHIPDVYDNSFFSLVSGNEVGSIQQSGVDLGHNPELNVVLEQFSPTTSNGASPDKECECPDDTTKSSATAAERAAFEEKAGKCMVTAFPLQKWVHVVISQYNQVLDIYVDGKLSSSCVLPGFPDIIQDDLVIAPEDGFSGKITKVVYLNSSVSADDVYSMYSDGPEHYDTLLSRVPNWAWGVLALIVLAVIVYSL